MENVVEIVFSISDKTSTLSNILILIYYSLIVIIKLKFNFQFIIYFHWQQDRGKSVMKQSKTVKINSHKAQ